MAVPLRLRTGNRRAVKPAAKRTHHQLRLRGAGIRRLTYIDGTCVEMLRAKTVRRNNTSGVPGVEWVARKQRWRASICFKGKRHYLGSYRSFDDAVKARKEAEEEFHDRFLHEFAAQQAREAADRQAEPPAEEPKG